MLEHDYLNGRRNFHPISDPFDFSAGELNKRDATLYNPLIRFGKRTIPDGKYSVRRPRNDEFQSTPLIRFGKRSM
ncbi:hypothetical protein AB6A40_002652 [Gnathostoma spinigerum]|uniref:Uncharacterized protein n=1 Tax=Gnathostoma spinigerum TaxID=75299 RepID=A0ABD6EG91_9BILA